MTPITKQAHVTIVETAERYDYVAFDGNVETRPSPVSTRIRVTAEGPEAEITYFTDDMPTPGQQITITIATKDQQ